MINIPRYAELKSENLRIAATVNRAWGASVAWVEDRETDGIILPVVASRTVGGLVAGLSTPPFRAAR